MTAEEMKPLILAEQQLPYLLRHQISDRSHQHFGGFRRGTTGRASAENAGATPANLITMACLYTHPDSRYFKDEQLLLPMEAATEFLRRSQRRDGLLSMDGCNFDSPPDTAFVVVGLAELYKLLQDTDDPELRAIGDGVGAFLAAAEPGLVHGGVHTPNHRWVVAAALVLLAELTGSQRAETRAQEWLAEGIDCSEDGQWTERSNGVYNIICNIMFWHLAQHYNDASLLEPVRRNLNSITQLIHPDGLLVTDYSTRQDRLVPHYMDSYYLLFRLMAGHDRNPQWAWWSDRALELMATHGPKHFSACTHELLYHMRYPQHMENHELERAVPSIQYRAAIAAKGSGHSVLRQRDGDSSLTLVSASDTIGSYHFGQARMVAIRPTVAFFGKAVVCPSHWQTASDGSYLAEVKIEAPYFSPLSAEDAAELPPNVDPLDLYHSRRQESDVCHLLTQINVMPKDNGFDLHWTLIPSVASWDVMTQLTLQFSPEGQWDLDYGLRLLADGVYLMEGRWAIYRCGPWVLEVERLSPEEPEHFLPALRGDVERTGSRYLLLNGLSGTPTKLSVRAYQAGVR